jgi:hypothetical protein
MRRERFLSGMTAAFALPRVGRFVHAALMA